MEVDFDITRAYGAPMIEHKYTELFPEKVPGGIRLREIYHSVYFFVIFDSNNTTGLRNAIIHHLYLN